MPRNSCLRTGLLATLVILAGCASAPPLPPPPPALSDSERLGVERLGLMADPWEAGNRDVYRFNALLDEAVLLPAVRTYRAATPEFLRHRVSDFFGNLDDVRTFINGALQLRPQVAGQAFGRVAINSSFGLLGLVDVADAFGMPQPEEDFGQTLGWWGVPSGPYRVLPLLGPSSLRDAMGFGADFSARVFWEPTPLRDPPGRGTLVSGAEALDTRHRIGFRYFETGSPFEYELVRFLYGKKRELDVRR